MYFIRTAGIRTILCQQELWLRAWRSCARAAGAPAGAIAAAAVEAAAATIAAAGCSDGNLGPDFSDSHGNMWQAVRRVYRNQAGQSGPAFPDGRYAKGP